MKGQERLSWSQLLDLFFTLRRCSSDHPFPYRGSSSFIIVLRLDI